MKKNVFCLALGAMLFALCFSAEAQQPKKVPLIGILGASSISDVARIQGIRHALREIGYVEGQNIAIEERFYEGASDRSRRAEVAAELVRLKIDVIDPNDPHRFAGSGDRSGRGGLR